VTVRRLLDQHGIHSDRRTTRDPTASERGRRVQAVSVAARRAARLAELGFADLEAYLWVRRLQQGWPIWRLRAELKVSRAWLTTQLDQLGILRR
jgi:hypothetical protein